MVMLPPSGSPPPDDPNESPQPVRPPPGLEFEEPSEGLPIPSTLTAGESWGRVVEIVAEYAKAGAEARAKLKGEEQEADRLRSQLGGALWEIRELLADFDLLVRTSKGAAVGEALVAVLKQTDRVLLGAGYERVSAAVGDAFESGRHRAVEAREDPRHPEGTILSVERGGFRLEGRLVRLPEVVVARDQRRNRS